jgi:predicted dehydrogenase
LITRETVAIETPAARAISRIVALDCSPLPVLQIGLADMAEAIAEGHDHRATGQLGLHVVDVGRSILRSAAEGEAIEIGTSPVRPAPLPVGASAVR